ncbi:MAG: hypothetical protein IJV99_03845 [Clostridia bacterium]|nr:hypothetical protein [Clostridia bacterium]
MKYVKHFLKQAVIPVIYLVLMAMTSLSIGAIEGQHLVWLRLLLSILAFGLYALVVGAISYKEGQEAMKVRNANDLERMIIVRTGENRPLQTVKEFKAWKGFMVGLVTCIPAIVILIVHTILIIGNPANIGAGVLAGYIYMVFFMIFRCNTAVAVTAGTYYLILLAIPVFACLTGIPYYLGGRKIELQQERIKEKHRQIYGE